MSPFFPKIKQVFDVWIYWLFFPEIWGYGDRLRMIDR